MTVGVPLGLLALAGVPVLVALYLLRRRGPPRIVSAVFLWRTPDDSLRAGPRLERPRRELSLLLESLAVVCAALFLADFRFATASAGAHTVVVLDGSLSMRARGRDGRTAADRAKDEVRRLLRERGGAATLIESGPRPRVLAGPAAPSAAALRALDAWLPGQGAHGFAEAWALARDLADGAAPVFVTDALPGPAVPVPVHAAGEAASNVAFVAAERRDTSSQTVVALQVRNFGPAARPRVVLRDEEGREVLAETLALGKGESARLERKVARAGTLRAELPDDALPEDGRLLLLPEAGRIVRIRNALPAGTAAFDAVRRFVASARDVAAGEPADLHFVPPEEPGASPWSVAIGANPPLTSTAGPFVAERNHPLLEDVRLDGVVWTSGASVPGRALVLAGPVVLLSEEPGPRLHLNAELARSSLQRSAAWPLLLGNLVEWRRASLPGFSRHNLALGDGVAACAGATGSWTLQGPEGTRVLTAGCLQLPAPAAGRYALLRDGREFDVLSVLPVDARESDLEARGSGRAHPAESSRRSASSLPERSPLPLALMLGLLLMDWCVAAPGLRRGGGRA